MNVKNVSGSNLGFQSRKDKTSPVDKTIKQAIDFVNLDDSQLKQIAYQSSYDKKEHKRQKGNLTKLLLAIPVVDTVAKGILTKKVYLSEGDELLGIVGGSLGDKAFMSSKVAGKWAGGIAAVGAYNVVKHAIVSDSDTVKKFEQNHPILSFMGDIGVILTGLTLGSIGLDKFNEKYPKSLETFIEKRSEVRKFLDNTKFNKEIMPKISEFVAKADSHASISMTAGRLALYYSWAFVLGAGIFKAVQYAANNQKKVENNYYALKDQQKNVAKNMVNIIGCRAGVLEYQNKMLVNELVKEKQMQKINQEILLTSLAKSQEKPATAKHKKTIVIYE